MGMFDTATLRFRMPDGVLNSRPKTSTAKVNFTRSTLKAVCFAGWKTEPEPMPVDPQRRSRLSPVS